MPDPDKQEGRPNREILRILYASLALLIAHQPFTISRRLCPSGQNTLTLRGYEVAMVNLSK